MSQLDNYRDSDDEFDYFDCWDCGGECYTHHDCGEDCCMCADPDELNVPCYTCGATGVLKVKRGERTPGGG
jgi:hypothetical protein